MDAKLQDCFASTDWNMFRDSSVGKDPHIAAVTAYENIINDAAKDGWELVQADSITSVQNPAGCLSGTKSEAISFKLLIFKKQV